MTSEQQELISLWQSKQNQMKALVAEEMELRKMIVSTCFDTSVVSGTDYIELGHGWRLKAVKKENYNLKNDTDQVDKALDKFNPSVADFLVKWSPTLQLKVYNSLTDEEKKHFEGCLEIKPASPTLEIVAPKA